MIHSANAKDREGVHDMRLKVKIGFVMIPITFVATFFTILCGCWPVSKHWQINPNPGSERLKFLAC